MVNLLKHPNPRHTDQATAKPKTVWRLIRSTANDNTPPLGYWIIRVGVVSFFLAGLFYFGLK
jgi:hypothetical protein